MIKNLSEDSPDLARQLQRTSTLNANDELATLNDLQITRILSSNSVAQKHHESQYNRINSDAKDHYERDP